MDKEPPRNGYRGLGADVGVGSGGTGLTGAFHAILTAFRVMVD